MNTSNKTMKILLSILLFFTIVTPLSLQAKPTKRLTLTGVNPQLIKSPEHLTIISSIYYDGDSDDLITAGLGFTRLSSNVTAPIFVNPSQPTLQELRQAKLNRFINIKTGEGSLFGFRQQELTPLFDGKIAGTEILATSENGNIGFLLQIPLDFDKNKPCIVAVPSTDFDGLFNARDLQIRGLWGLRHNCAVVYNDKGLANSIYDITQQRGYSLAGITQTTNLLFHPTIDNSKSFIQKYPNRFAIKQLHSKENLEQYWGEFILKSIEFAFYQLNSKFSATQTIIFNKDNTLVLVYGASDGGGAALKAGELDKDNIIKGIVAVNPQIYSILPKTPITIKYGKNSAKKIESKSIADYSSYAALYIPCAVPAIIANKTKKYIPYADKFLYAKNRCNALKKAKLLSKGTPKEALKKLHQYGWTANMDIQLPYFYFKESIGLPYQYISAYGRFDVSDNMCNYSVASTQQNPIYYKGDVAPLKEVSFEQLWGFANGHLPLWFDGDDSTIMDLVNNEDHDSHKRDFYSSSQPKGKIDYNTNGAICLRNKLKDPRVQEGLNQVAMTGNLNKIKTFIVHARNNVKQLPNTIRAYVALNSLVENKSSQLRYIEVENTSYLNGEVPFDNTLLSIDYYGEDAMEWLWANLTTNATLPESQIVHTKAQGGKSGYTLGITTKNLVPISQSPNRKYLIKKENGKITLPY